MKKLLIILLIYLYLSGFSAVTDTVRIVFLHPTVHNIETFIFLKDSGLICIENVQFVGVYYDKEQYDYQQSIDFLNDTSLNYISLQKISGNIEQADIFKDNNLTNSFDSLFSVTNGIVFMGGDDISPSVYGSKTNLLTGIDDMYRHYFEISFMHHLIGNNDMGYTPLLEKNNNYVVLGICLGMQTMNVAMDGDLYQDIPSEIYGFKYVEDVITKPELMHKNYNKSIIVNDSILGAKMHNIKATKQKNKVFSILSSNKTPNVLSWHHQAIKTLGDNLDVIFTSMDGKVAEGISHNDYPNVYGFQFHPEYTKLYRTDILFKEYPNSKAKSLNAILVERNSLQFHKDLWKFFSNMFKN